MRTPNGQKQLGSSQTVCFPAAVDQAHQTPIAQELHIEILNAIDYMMSLDFMSLAGALSKVSWVLQVVLRQSWHSQSFREFKTAQPIILSSSWPRVLVSMSSLRYPLVSRKSQPLSWWPEVSIHWRGKRHIESKTFILKWRGSWLWFDYSSFWQVFISS